MKNYQPSQAAKRFAERIVDTVREVLVVLDADMRVLQANRWFYELFQLPEAEEEGRFPNMGYRQLSLNARLLKAEETEDQKILLAIRDVTDKGALL
ncbi:MAG: PAS domain-containing protein [Thermodesulfobacteriota bacterium]